MATWIVAVFNNDSFDMRTILMLVLENKNPVNPWAWVSKPSCPVEGQCPFMAHCHLIWLTDPSQGTASELHVTHPAHTGSSPFRWWWWWRCLWLPHLQALELKIPPVLLGLWDYYKAAMRGDLIKSAHTVSSLTAWLLCYALSSSLFWHRSAAMHPYLKQKCLGKGWVIPCLLSP